jgi:hypothetical protein
MGPQRTRPTLVARRGPSPAALERQPSPKFGRGWTLRLRCGAISTLEPRRVEACLDRPDAGSCAAGSPSRPCRLCSDSQVHPYKNLGASRDETPREGCAPEGPGRRRDSGYRRGGGPARLGTAVSCPTARAARPPSGGHAPTRRCRSSDSLHWTRRRTRVAVFLPNLCGDNKLRCPPPPLSTREPRRTPPP